MKKNSGNRPDRQITIRYHEPAQFELDHGDDPSWVINITAYDADRRRGSTLRLNRSEAKQLQRELAWAMPEKTK